MSSFKKPIKKIDKSERSENRNSANSNQIKYQNQMEDQETKIKRIKEKKKLKTLATQLKYPSLENELEEEENFMENIKSGTTKFDAKLKSRYDESGIEFTPFNMSEEMEEGRIDETGHFIYNKRSSDYDPWYDSVKEEIVKKEKDKKLLNDNLQEDEENKNTTNQKDDENVADFNYYGEEDLYYKEEKISQDELNDIQKEIKENRLKLVKYLKDENETVQQAIHRLKPKEKGYKPFKPIRKKQKTENDSEANLRDNNNRSNQNDEKVFKELLDIVSKLTELSFFNVYTDSYERIKKSLGAANLIKWKYRTVPVSDEENIESNIKEYGEFTTEEIKSWINQNLLRDTNEFKIELKMIEPFEKEEENTWMTIDHQMIKEFMK